MTTPIASRRFQEFSALSQACSSALHAAGATIVAKREVKGRTREAKYAAPIDDVNKTSCKICDRARVIFDDDDMRLVAVTKEAICHKAYGEWMHNGCEKIIQPYQQAIINRIQENKIKPKKQQNVYNASFEVLKDGFKPISLKLVLLHEDDAVKSRIEVALNQALKTVDKCARELDVLQTVPNHELEAAKKVLANELKGARRRAASWRI